MSYKPQFAYPTPEGFRDEPFSVSFAFTFPGNGSLQRQLPVQLDDDQPFIIRGIYFTKIGTEGAFPGLCRIWDTTGNPLSKDLILALGMWSLAGLDTSGGVYVGFPIEPENLCAPGGAIFFDFQLRTNATVALLQVSGNGGDTIFYAGVAGTAGNGRTIALVDPGAPSSALQINIAGNNVSISLATDGGGAITSTYFSISEALNNDAAALGIMAAAFDSGSDPAAVVIPIGATPLTSGEASTPQTVNGTLFGVKRFTDC